MDPDPHHHVSITRTLLTSDYMKRGRGEKKGENNDADPGRDRPDPDLDSTLSRKKIGSDCK